MDNFDTVLFIDRGENITGIIVGPMGRILQVKKEIGDLHHQLEEMSEKLALSKYDAKESFAYDVAISNYMGEVYSIAHNNWCKLILRSNDNTITLDGDYV